jgi:hypothetical protein
MPQPILLKAHRGQKIVLKDGRRFKVIVAGRRWGKTQISKIALIKAAVSRKNQLCWYVAPTYQMARQILWEDLKRSIPKKLIVYNGINETRMTIKLINGSRIELKGADNPDSLRGVGINFLVLDEAQDMRPEVWEEVLRPTLASTGGQVIFIGTPKSFNWFYDLYVLGQRGDTYKDDKDKVVINQWKSWQFPTIMSPFIPRAEIEHARREMDPKTFRQEFEASFETMSGRVYYAFNRKAHVGEYPFNPNLDIIVGQDFNIDPMSSVIMQVQPNGEIWVVDEAILFGSNTQETADEIARRYYRQMNRTTFYPDPAGNNRSHGRGESDLDILRDAGFKRIIFHRKHPPVADRVNSVNRLLMSAEGTIKMKFDRKCRHTIAAMEQTIYKAGTRDVDKTMGVEHPADALGYYAHYEYPVRKIEILGVSL